MQRAHSDRARCGSTEGQHTTLFYSPQKRGWPRCSYVRAIFDPTNPNRTMTRLFPGEHILIVRVVDYRAADTTLFPPFSPLRAGRSLSPSLRASTEHRLRVRGARARGEGDRPALLLYYSRRVAWVTLHCAVQRAHSAHSDCAGCGSTEGRPRHHALPNSFLTTPSHPRYDSPAWLPVAIYGRLFCL